jgi:hypothetical protein
LPALPPPPTLAPAESAADPVPAAAAVAVEAVLDPVPASSDDASPAVPDAGEQPQAEEPGAEPPANGDATVAESTTPTAPLAPLTDPVLTPDPGLSSDVCTGPLTATDQYFDPARAASWTHGYAAAAVSTSSVEKAAVPATTLAPRTPSSSSSAPLAPAGLPAPVPAPAPAGSSAAASAGTSGCGHGHTEHIDLTYAVVDGGSGAEAAHTSVRPTQGFAGSVVGGADDPGVRPD